MFDKKIFINIPLRNHVHTNYANRIHTHDGIYASYHHHHDNYITREDLNKAISNILSINPDIVTIISQIATDLETLQNTFVTRDENVEVIMNIENRLTNLEEIQESSLYLKIFEDENTNLVSQVGENRRIKWIHPDRNRQSSNKNKIQKRPMIHMKQNYST